MASSQLCSVGFTSWKKVLSAQERLCSCQRKTDSQQHQNTLHLHANKRVQNAAPAKCARRSESKAEFSSNEAAVLRDASQSGLENRRAAACKLDLADLVTCLVYTSTPLMQINMPESHERNLQQQFPSVRRTCHA